MFADFGIMLAYLAAITILFLLGRLMIVPKKFLMKLVVNTIMGGIALIAINLVGGLFGFHIAFNIVTSLVVGMLGIPGVLLLIILRFLFGA